MYSGSTLTAVSGRLLGAHQKIDKAARRHLDRLAPACRFPSSSAILHFEGDNGPDAIKRKSPARDEPWHYIQPFDAKDVQLLGLIASHYKKLVGALVADDQVRAAFEASWLAHALVDGLTPAHHYPYEEKLVELRSGKGIETRTTIREKLLMPGETTTKQLHNNWKMWGPKGLFTTHAAFEWGVATLIVPLSFKSCLPSASDIDAFQKQSIETWYRHVAQDVARMNIYDEFYRSGWTVRLARQVRRKLAPMLVSTVATVWYAAVAEAGVSRAGNNHASH
ncbi:hypothetical protein H7171_01560 [Candidatus Saccharibacteria bacterium]|nr:hypothetical protein [Candidatus Saccharibacteria bacterium]